MAVMETSPATAVERALNILEAAAQRREGLTNAEISRKLGIPKSSASYILRTLEKRSYLRRETETGRYRLGLKVLSLGGDAQTNLDVAHVALPFMRSLVDKIRMTSHLAVLDQGEAVYIEKVEAPGFFKVNTWVGRRMFLHSTSVGKCLLAWLPKHEVETIAKQQGLKRRTPETITSIAKLLADLERVKQSGYAVDDEENSLGARCFGAPIFDTMGNVTAALGASGTLTQTDEANMPRIIEALDRLARGPAHSNDPPYSNDYLPSLTATKLFFTEKTLGTWLARKPATFLSVSLSTTPSSVTLPFFTMIWMEGTA